ncbi:MAG TPA: DUF370 domain-containing protein [Syntrophomonadaceae bacterium]|jgi:regulator of extracellular matrix RemA (YlzA/DUF370 family)|nr:DUF370 domain-containing protein [Syntrophomonadaceae bacterium]HRX20819.1 DUF370 domain-containing protein [Syntrophomonadaceae bacterium]
MYIHLGNNYIIPSADIIAILNIEPPISKDIIEIIEIAKTEKSILNVSEKGKEKAMIICTNKVYLSPISSTTLFRRANNFYREV